MKWCIKVLLFVMILYLLFLLVVFLLDIFLAKKLSKYCRMEKGFKTFAYDHLSLESNLININIKRSLLHTSFTGLFNLKHSLFSFDIDELEINMFSKIHIKSKKMSKVGSSLGKQLFCYLLLYFIRRFSLKIKKFKFKYRDFSIELNNFIFDYLRKSDFCLGLSFSSFLTKYNDIFFELNEYSYQSLIEPEIVLSMINFEMLILPFNFEIPDINIAINNKSFMISSHNISLKTPRGELSFNIPDLKGVTNFDLLSIDIRVKHISGFKTFVVTNIEQLDLDILKFDMDLIEVYFNDKTLLYLDKMTFEKKFNNLNLKINNVEFNYYTYFAYLLLSKFVSPVNKPIDLPEPDIDKTINLFLPEGELQINTIFINLYFTDAAKMSFNISDIKSYKKQIIISDISNYWNDSLVIHFKEMNIELNSSAIITITDLIISDDLEMDIPDFLAQVIRGLRCVICYAPKSSGQTMIFATLLNIKNIRLIFADTELHRDLSAFQRGMIDPLKNNYARMYIMDKKLSPYDDAFEKAFFSLKNILFQEYKNNILERHHHSFSFNIQNLQISIDSKNFYDHIEFMKEVDPNTIKLYPNMRWEILLGFNLSSKIENIKFIAYDIIQPLYEFSNIEFGGKLLISEGWCDQKAQLRFSSLNEKLLCSYNPADLHFVNKIDIKVKDSVYYYGKGLDIVYGSFTRKLDHFIAKPVDNSPPLKFWDGLRCKFRGVFDVSIDTLQIRFPSNDTFRELDNYTDHTLKNCSFHISDGVFDLKCTKFTCNVYSSNVKGPSLFVLPNFTCRTKIIWKTSAETYATYMFGEPQRFLNPENDTYRDFRATGVEMRFDIKIDCYDDFPIIEADVLHHKWLFSALCHLYSPDDFPGDVMKEPNEPYDSRLKIRTFSGLDRTFIIVVQTPCLVTRVYDSFPIENKIFGTSIDVRYTNFSCDIRMHFGKDPNGIEYYKVNSDVVNFNASDISRVSTYKKGSSPTFLVIEPLKFDTLSQNTFELDSVKILVDQVFVQYLEEFVFSILEVVKLINTPNYLESKKNNAIESTDDRRTSILSSSDGNDSDIRSFDETLGSLLINTLCIRIDSSSTKFATNFNINKISASWLKDKQGSHALHLTCQDGTVDVYTQKNRNFNNIMYISMIDTFIKKGYYSVDIKNITLQAKPDDVATLNFLYHEIFMSITTGYEISPSKDWTEYKFYFNIDSAKWTLYNNNGELASVKWSFVYFMLQQYINGVTNIYLTIQNFSVYNTISSRSFVSRKDDEINAHPHILFQCKYPPVYYEKKSNNSVRVFLGAELAVSPTNINYETVFRDEFVAFFEENPPGDCIYQRPKFELGSPSFELPSHKYTVETFQGICEMPVKKSSNIEVAKKIGSSYIIINYCHIAPVSVVLSYNNPRGMIPNISGFNGELPEFSYHNVKGSPFDIIEILSMDLAKVMIPLFLKHIVGVKKEEKEEPKIVSNDAESKKRRQKILIFGRKSVK